MYLKVMNFNYCFRFIYTFSTCTKIYPRQPFLIYLFCLYKVSDGIETSGPGVLRISVVPLQVRLVNNTGLFLVHNSYAIITSDNLTFTTNADETNVHVK